ncbi:sensor histidine kinase [Neomicrococcus lactis]|uniref:histidine kinase n=1 Tax=Neomicrococcus lactis TaxID=732241 RepID=A0A7W9DBY4_9MICC|nr:histidine kinase [Neomicrococcus lactis]MBB5598581.1 signal transduction histidine kinase [Neomicrococcus lactis]
MKGSRVENYFTTSPLPIWWRTIVLLVASWSLITDVPWLLSQHGVVGTGQTAFAVAALVLLSIGPFIATFKAWLGAALTIVAALSEINGDVSPALLFLFALVIVCAFTATEQLSLIVAITTVVWMIINAILTPAELVGVPLFAVALTCSVYAVIIWGKRQKSRAEDIARDRAKGEQMHQSALMSERKLIARDLHDVIAHDITIVALQADMAMTSKDHEQSAASLNIISQAAHRALDDLRSMMRVLTPTLGDVSEQAPDATLKTFMSEAELTLANLRFNVSLEAPENYPATTSDRGLSPFVREATSNILSHARPGATVELSYGATEDSVWCRFANEYSAGSTEPDHDAQQSDSSASRPRIPSSGFGRGFMRERIERLGGTVSMGPDASRQRWVVHAEVPRISPP